ncbi:MAG: maleylacetoacetate isomerase [Alphaproteobacteria bacterium]|nr:maleylacetoacetate isomerase [Alphaproteobacteria bacterium]
MALQLYGFWRSLAAYRVRAALKLKGLPFVEHSVNLLAGEQHDPAYLKINPQGAVPALVVDGLSRPLFQSMAILDYLDHAHPTPALMPADPVDRSRVLALAHLCASDGHPLVVPRVRNYLQNTLQLDEATRNTWLQHFTMQALLAYERALSLDPRPGAYSHGDQVTVADLCLASQVVGAKLFGCTDFSGTPQVMSIFNALMKLDALQSSLPQNQPGAPK